LELIRRWLPRFNVQGKPGRWRHAYLCVGRSPGAYVYLLPKPAASARHVFGPVSGGWKMRRAVERLNDVCRLRDCPDRVPMVFREQSELFDEVRSPQCMRYELGRCLGPCAALCTSTEYARAARRARKFIDGSDPGPLEAMEADMREAAELRQFERAAMLRDHLDDLRYLRDQVARIEHVRKHYTFVYPVECHDQRERWYLIRNGYLAGVLRAPSDSVQAARCRRGLQRVFKTNDAVGGASVEEQLDFVRLVSSWFRFRPEELERTITVEEAIARTENPSPSGRRCRVSGG
jgi:excinuclease ABC subunit C